MLVAHSLLLDWDFMFTPKPTQTQGKGLGPHGGRCFKVTTKHIGLELYPHENLIPFAHHEGQKESRPEVVPEWDGLP